MPTSSIISSVTSVHGQVANLTTANANPGLLTAFQNRYLTTKILSEAEVKQMKRFNLLPNAVFIEYLRNLAITVRPGVVDSLTRTFEFNPSTKQLFHRPAYNLADLNSHEAQIISEQYNPSIDEALTLYNRGVITSNVMDICINRQVGYSQGWAEAWKELRFQIPGPSDLIRFAVREAFDPETIRAFEYHKEFPVSIESWMDKQGYGQDIGIAIPDGGTDNNGRPRRGNATWSDLYWWSHWELPSLGQGYEMMHRLYPQSRYGPSPTIVGNASFTPQDLERLQKAQDIPSYWRSRLQAISYQPLTRVDVQRMYTLNILPREAVYHAFRANGYDDTNAENMTRFVDRLKAKSMGLDPSKAVLGWIESNYKKGYLQDDEVKNRLSILGYPDEFHNSYLAKLKLDVSTQAKDDYMKWIRKSFMMGVVGENEVRNAMLRENMNGEVVRAIIFRWAYQRRVSVRFLSARQNLRLFEDNIITEDELTARLQNLNYDSTDITRMISHSKFKKSSNRNKEREKQLKNNQRQIESIQKEALKAAKEAVKAEQQKAKEIAKKQKEALQQLLAGSTDKNLKQWFKDGLLTVADIIVRLSLKGWVMGDIKRWVLSNFKEITEEQFDAEKKKAKEQQKQGGPSGDDGK